MFIKTIIIVCLLLSGCAVQSDTNKIISESNRESTIAMYTALANAKDPSAIVAISVLHAVGAGRQQFFREHDVLDYMQGFLPYATLLAPFAYGYNSKQNSMAAGRDIYIDSVRGDTSWAHQSALQEYTLDNGSYASSNDQEEIANSDHSIANEE